MSGEGILSGNMTKESLEALTKSLIDFRSKYYHNLTVQERMSILKVVNAIDHNKNNIQIIEARNEFRRSEKS